MARSTYIYVVIRDDASLPAAAFTVKHEMKAWVKRRGLQPESTSVYRYPDDPTWKDSAPALMNREDVFG